MEPNWGFTASGFIRPTMQEIKEYLIASYLEIIPDANFTHGSILDIQISAEAEVKAKQYADLERALEETYLDSSNGLFVDRNIKPIGKKRKQPTYAYAKVKFEGVSGKYIARGVSLTTASGLVFKTIEDGTINSEGIILKVSADNVGSQYNVSKGTINSLMKPDMDIIKISNVDPATGGADIEKDYEVKERIYQGFIKSENKPVDIINYEISSIDGVKSSIVLENKSESYQGVVGPHSLLAVVDGGKEDDILNVLFDFLPFGVQTKTNQTERVVSKVVSDGPNIYQLSFLRPEVVAFSVKVEVVVSSVLSESEKQDISTMVRNIYTGLKVGEVIVPRDIFKLIGDIVNYNSVKVAMTKDSSNWVDFIAIEPTQIGSLGEVIVIG